MNWNKEEDDHSRPQVPSVHALIRRGLTAQALVALDNGADVNSKDEEGRLLTCEAILCGNEDVLKRLLQLGADISVTPRQHGNRVQGRSPIPVSITLLLVTLQFRFPPGILEAFKFVILSVPVENYIWSILTSADIHLDKRIIWCIAIIYLPIFLISHFFTAHLQALAFALLHSQSFFAYLSRRLLLHAAHFATAPPHSQLARAPGVEAAMTVVEHGGKAEEMMLLLLQGGLDLGSPEEKGGLFQTVWIWAIRHEYIKIMSALLSCPGLPSYLFVRSEGPESFDILSYVAYSGYAKLLQRLLDAHNYEPSAKDAALLVCLSHISMNTDRCVATVALLLQYGANPSVARHEGRSALSWACHFEDCHIQLVPLLLKHGAGVTVNSYDRDGQAALHHAVWWNGENSKLTIDLLLEAGADINILDTSGHTPLWEAASKAVPPVIAHLLTRGAIVDFRSPESTSPLMEACLHNSIVAVAILLADGADPNVSAPDDTPLASALRQDYRVENADVVYTLLQAGARPIVPLSPQFQLTRQPIVQCVHCTREEGEWLLELLEAARVDGPIPQKIVNRAIQQSFEYVPFMRLDGLLALLQAGGDPSIQSMRPWVAEGGNVMHFVVRNYPCHRGDVRTILRFLVNSPFLLRPGGDLLLDRENMGGTPLHTAAYSVNKLAMKELMSIAKSLNLMHYVNMVDSYGYTALAVACQCPPTSTTGYTLLNHHPDLDGPDFFGGRLHNGIRAAMINQRFEQATYSTDLEDIVHLLREAGSNPFMTSNGGMTPLHLACQVGNPITAGVLLQNRKIFQSSAKLGFAYTMHSLLSLNDDQGRTPLHWAARSGNVDLVRMILATNVLRFFNGAEVTPDEYIACPLHTASESEFLHAEDDSGYIPLHHAIEEGHLGVVNVFLDEVEGFHWDLDPDPADGISAIRLAKTRGHNKILALLERTLSTKSPASQEFKSYQSRSSCNFDQCSGRGFSCRWCRYQQGWMSE